MIVLIGGEKGGTGKTTIATNLAVIRAGLGHDVLLVDTDKQGSASYWANVRDDQREDATDDNIKHIANIQKFGSNIATDLTDLQKRYEDIIIDAGGKDSVELRSAMTVANVMYIPVRAAQFDIWTLDTIDKLAERAKIFNKGLEARILINAAPANPSVSEIEEAKAALSDFEFLKLSDCLLKERICYRKAARDGIAITEQKQKDQKAIQEFMTLYKEIFNDEKK